MGTEGLDATLIDDAPVSRFHRKLMVACGGGPFLDGYVLSVVGVALTGMTADLHLSTVEVSAVAAASLVGIFFGALVFGSVTDRIGREKMYTLDLAVLVIGSILSIFVGDGWQVVAIRFGVGVAIGADYPIATTLLTEFLPARKRGSMIGVIAVAWALGAAAAFLVSYVVVMFGGPGLWRWLLASTAVVALVVLALRRGTPESPRWLIRKGRFDQAAVVIRAVYGRPVTPSALRAATLERAGAPAPSAAAQFRMLFGGGYGRRTLMCSLLYLCQITPQQAIYAFGPTLLLSFGITGASVDTLGQALIGVLFLVGNLLALRLLESWGRRPMSVYPYLLMILPMVALWLVPHGPVWFVVLAFCLYALFSGGPSLLEWVYPNELFPTEIRATAVGLVTASTRIGSAAGTFLLPIGLREWGTGPTMAVGAVITAVGFLAVLLWAPETKGMTLQEASAVPGRAGAAAPEAVEDIVGGK